MKRSWLIQRLQKPRSFGQIKDNPFAFGGGLRNGGLSGDAMDLLRPIFSFDYMGAAEFEFGAVPKALDGIAKDHKRLAAGSFEIRLADVAPHWSERKAKQAPTGSATIYYLARRDDVAEVETRIREWAKQGYRAELKESTNLDSTLRPHYESDGDTQGWLELDNGFLFFTDAEMWQQTCALFGLDVEVAA